MQCVIDQYVKEVTDFSSQYGSDGSISYVANNIIGKPTLYPEYGDFSSAYCLRTYGRWWNKCDSSSTPIDDPRPMLPPTVDFIDVKYEHPVYPIRVDIYETYHPGSVVRIWGSLEGHAWVLLWAGEPQSGLKGEARIFSPPLMHTSRLVNLLRIEFDQLGQTYYSALDAIVLVGSTHTASRTQVASLDTITSQVIKLGLHTARCEEDILAGVRFLLSEENVQRLLAEAKEADEPIREEKADLMDARMVEDCPSKTLTLVDVCEAPDALDDGGTNGGYFDLLPEELILYILRHLDLRTLCRLSLTCRLLHRYTSEPCLYMNLNLKNCWWLVNNTTLEYLSGRCSLLQALDLSWCGPYDALHTHTFMEFIHSSGRQLTTLRLNNCHFIDNYCLYMIANVCLSLEELSMANCIKVDHLGFGELKKAWALCRLDLSRTRIDFHTLQLLLQHAGQLRHLSLNNCTQLDMDEVALTLATFNKGLVSLTAWKTHGITNPRGCKDLKRLYLTALRTLTDHDLHQLITHSHGLTQLDIMGTRNVTPDTVYRLLQTCPQLELLDVSFCEQIHSTLVHQWVAQFPAVSIKGGLFHQVRIRGLRRNNYSACEECSAAPEFYDKLYLGFMGLLPLTFHLGCIDAAAKRRT
ncbi:F-box/LRR-repeat protein 4-like 5 [Homarus americanus]|uniref:F-box/LRR-repeat protein 4-like 5 n=1 Tax=Homarus americanus TaxID=6706 RepID=A0A8J5MXG4_HOMAM|nr:F-box/LRR-repeat protein 4-like 5 [Homarus americanus]